MTARRRHGQRCLPGAVPHASHSTMRPRDDGRSGFQLRFDLAQVSNIHTAQESIQCNPTLNQHDAPWRIKLPQGGVAARAAALPVTAGTMPANSRSSRSGPAARHRGHDNSEDIGTSYGRPLARPARRFHPPQNGALIGGTQTVTMHGETGSTDGARSPERQQMQRLACRHRYGLRAGTLVRWREDPRPAPAPPTARPC